MGDGPGGARIAIVDYDVGNVGSIANMLRRCGAEPTVTADHDELARARKIILPGVGSFDHGMRKLRDRGLVDVLESRVSAGVPLLGICLGMQLLGEGSEEGTEPGLGWIAGGSIKFRFEREASRLKVPHMGWNHVRPAPGVNGQYGLDGDARFYFVHSYHLRCRNESDVLATTTYGYPFVSAVRRGNVLGVQFHPEKSHRFGLALLSAFAAS